MTEVVGDKQSKTVFQCFRRPGIMQEHMRLLKGNYVYSVFSNYKY